MTIPIANMHFDKKFFNVIILGFSFMFIFTAFQTSGIIQDQVLKSFKRKEDNNYAGDGLTSLAIIYSILAIGNWLAPSALTFTGPKLAMLIGGLTYSLFVANFLYPLTWGLYVASVLIGMGAALIWIGQGSFLTENSDSETMSRNSGIFWAMLQCSLLFGNIFVFLMLEGKEEIDKHTRFIVYGVLLGVCCVGCLFLLLLRGGGRLKADESAGVVIPSPKQAFVSAIKLLKTRNMILLSIAFIYTGLELSFFSGVYGTCLAGTKRFGEDSKKYMGISGMLIGCGEIIGGALFGILGKKTNKYGRDLIVMLGYVVHMVTFFMIFINIPDNATYKDTSDMAFIHPNIYIALTCSFILGFGDACFNTQVYSILGYVYSEDSAPAFAVFKFVQSVAAAAAFYYAKVLIVRYHLLILVVTGTAGALAFCQVEWRAHKLSREKRDFDDTDVEKKA